jgi:phage terminase small subunit
MEDAIALNHRRGPRKKPSVIETLQGRPGRRSPNNQEPMPPALSQAELISPVRLTAGAQRIWDRDSKIAYAVGCLTMADTRSFALYCQLQDLGDRCAAKAEKTLDQTQRPPLALFAAIKLWEKSQVIAGRFGFNPSDRSRVPSLDVAPRYSPRLRSLMQDR